MWTTNPSKVLYAYLEYLLSTNLLQEQKKGKEQGPAYIIPTPTQCSLVRQEDRCTTNQAEQMQSFASCIWRLTFAFLFIAWQVLPGKYSTQLVQPCLLFPRCLVTHHLACHEYIYIVRPGTAGLLTGIECSRVRDSSWMYLTSFVTTRIDVVLAAVQGNYPVVL